MAHIVDLMHMLVGPVARLTGRTATHDPAPAALPTGEGTHFSRVETDDLVDVDNEDWASALVEFGERDGRHARDEPGDRRAARAAALRGARHARRARLGARAHERAASATGSTTTTDEGYTRVFAGPRHPGFAAFQPGAGIPMGYDDLRVIEAANFLAAVRDGEQRGPGLDEMVACAHVLGAIERSAASGAWEGRRAGVAT